MKPSTSSTDARLAKLERELRGWRRAGLAIAFVFAVAVLTGATPRATVPDMLAAKTFSLVDDTGAVRGQWRLGSDGPEFAAFAPDGKLISTIAVTSEIMGETSSDRTARPPAPSVAPAAAKSQGSFIRFGAPEDADDEKDEDDFDWAE